MSSLYPGGASCEWVDGGNGMLVIQKKKGLMSVLFSLKRIYGRFWVVLGVGGWLVRTLEAGLARIRQESKERRQGKSFGANPKPIAMIHTIWIGESGGVGKWNSRICYVHLNGILNIFF